MRLSCLTMGLIAFVLAPSALAQTTGGAATAPAPAGAGASGGAPAAAPAAPPPAAAPPADPAAAPAAAAPAEAAAAPPADGAAPPADAAAPPAEGAAAPADAAAPPADGAEDPEAARIVYVKEPAKEEKKPSNEPTPAEVDPWKVPWTHHVSHIYLNAFAGLLFTPDTTYDVFADSDASFAFGARLGVPLFTMGHTGVSLTADWLATAQEGYARDTPTRLEQQRMGLGLELKHLLTPALGLYARLSAGAAYLDSRLGGEHGTGTLYADSWEFQAAGVAGGSLRLIGDKDGRSRSTRLYLTAEAGYTFVGETSLSYLPGESGPPRAEPFVLDGLYLGGPIATLGLALGY